MQLLDKVVVHRVQFPDLDPTLTDKFKILTIKAVRHDVPGMFSRSTCYTGYRAIDATGMEYMQYWDSFPDDSMNPTMSWYGTDGAWYDVVQVRNLKSKPRWLKGKFLNVVSWCSRHKLLFHVGMICYECDMLKKFGKERLPVRSMAKGW